MSPCYDAQEADDNRECRSRLTQVTRLLCDLCKAIESTGLMKAAPDELREWWDEHKTADEERG